MANAASAPASSAEPAAPTVSMPAPATVAPPRNRARTVLPLLGGAFAALALGVWLAGRGKESTDDAFVEAHVVNVAARVSGQVKRVAVKDNQEVREGDVLLELDDRDAKVRLAAASADLESARASLAALEAQLALTERGVTATIKQARGGVVQARALTGSSRAAVTQARADVTAAAARQRLAGTELKRAQKLAAEGATSAADLDARQANFDQADALLAQARARLVSALANIDNATGSVETAAGRMVAAQTGPAQVEAARAQVSVGKARVAQAEAAREQAELNLSYTVVRAPRAGVVSRRTVEPGQMVDPSRPLLAVTGIDDVWVVANFKEDQLAHMRPGQAAKVKIDAFSGRTFAAHVDSLAGGTGSRFALLPPDNASGNFTKVVQRVPVLIRIDGKPDLPLRPGMSALATVYVAD